MNGTPGMVTPITSRPEATRCISYQTDGNSICRCGSFARIGRPDFVLPPASTQLLLLPRRAPAASHSRPAGQRSSRFCQLLCPQSSLWQGENGRQAPLRRTIAGEVAGYRPVSSRATASPNFRARAPRTSSAWWFSASRHASSRPTASESIGSHAGGVMPRSWNSIGRIRPTNSADAAFTPAA